MVHHNQHIMADPHQVVGVNVSPNLEKDQASLGI